jgi:pyruvate-formate lyase
MTDLADRTLILRRRCLERKTSVGVWDSDPRLMALSLENTAGIAPWAIRRGMLTRDLLAGTGLALDDLELLVGRLAPDRPEWKEERELAQAYLREKTPHVFTPGQSGHCQLDLSRLLVLGVDGLCEEINRAAQAAQDKNRVVLQSFLLALAGLQALAGNAADTAEQARAQAQGERAAELEEMAAACRNIMHNPPATFREALQLSYLAILGCQVGDRAWLVSPGHIDRTLAPFYLADLDAGRITPQAALLLIEALYLLLNENIPDGLAISVMVGGRDALGQDLTNPLSYLCLEALRRTRLVYPTVGVCWHSGTPDDLTALAIDLIAQGYPNPAFFGDETIQRGLHLYGVPPEESWDYVNSTCVEITPVGSSNVWVASPYFSTCGLLVEELTAQVRSGQPAGTFEVFLDGYRARLAEQIAAAVAAENENRRVRREYGGKPLQSVFTRDCIQRGLDIDDGGARYNWVECSFVGLANLADSLHVLREEVFHLKRMTLFKMHQVLAANFQGYERERQRFLNAHPK